MELWIYYMYNFYSYLLNIDFQVAQLVEKAAESWDR